MEISPKEDISCFASETQRDVLKIICSNKLISEHFFITGGTALSVFYLHHRSSEDLDLFTINYSKLDDIDEAFKRTFREDLILIQSSTEFYSYLIKGVKVDVVFDPLSQDEERAMVNLLSGGEILVDTLENIASNKLCAIASRFEEKDLIDFFFIGKTFWMGARQPHFLKCYEMARKKEALLDDPAMAAYQVEQLLDRVLLEKERGISSMMVKIDWKTLENDMRYYIHQIYEMQKW
ncbi:MAG: nucleotidyl transferase AbiEii/AbiGii toxin family protein [Deltaproteobacteria bacterium]|nr:nucleotidyl transferase AbiEii/AbiGii toxin family protein [Deltaproteobacteria bacterium]MBW2063900.1 nucleotidyl transferase AbiEii/AbiGii toxin family protein [Deltaproteobacteria bacterium]